MATYDEVKERVLRMRRAGIPASREDCNFLNQTRARRIKNVCDYFVDSLPQEMKITPSDNASEVQLKLSFGEKLINFLEETFKRTLKIIRETFDVCVTKIKEFFSHILSF